MGPRKIGKKRSQGALGWFEAGRGWFKSEFRRPKAERNPKAEIRIQSYFSEAVAHRLTLFQDFGFRPSFGFRVSVFGFQGRSHCASFKRPGLRAALRVRL
jgi:hypothetical protein